MILIREAHETDVEALEKLASVPGFINLTSDRDVLREKIGRSLDAFVGKIVEKHERKFIFVAEDLTSGEIIGSSMVASKHGTQESPHFYFQVGNEEKYSNTINTGFIHGTLELMLDTDGPSEIGGLVLNPDWRNHESHVGRQLSFIRFMLIGLHRSWFERRILAELLPPLNKKGLSPLWEAIGRRFTNMDYWEADELCRKNKEFIESLFPSGKIYTTFLTAEAKNAVGRVGKDTEPVVRMLTKIGFKYLRQVDPFDGGPHFGAEVDDLVPIKKLAKYNVAAIGSLDSSSGTASDPDKPLSGLLALGAQRSGGFRAVGVEAHTSGRKLTIRRVGTVGDAGAMAQLLKAHLGVTVDTEVDFMPYY